MPHECTTCGQTFPDGSKEMLSGCPECGGNKFQFLPAGTVDGDERGAAEGDESVGTAPGEDTNRGSPDTIESPPDVTGSLERDGEPPSDPADDPTFEFGEDAVVERATDDESTDGEPEDRAQASARSSVVSEDELPRSAPEVDESKAPPTEGDAGGADPNPDPDDQPDLSELRQELNDQFESIKILQPGEYELNLMELYDREERIVALEEDGRYVIDVPSSWREDDE